VRTVLLTSAVALSRDRTIDESSSVTLRIAEESSSNEISNADDEV